MVSPFKEKIKNQTSKRSKQTYSFLPYLQDIVSVDPRMLESLAILSNIL